jgi:uncharacterized protein HemX
MMFMGRKKKFMVVGLLVLVVLGGTLGGIAMAQANDESANTTSQLSTLLDKVASIYQQNTGIAIDSQELAKAFTQAQKETRDAALDKYLNSLVEKGTITQDQANQFKTWLDAKPDITIGPGFKGGFRGMGRFGGCWNALNNGNGTSS